MDEENTIKRGSTTEITFTLPEYVPLEDIIAANVLWSWRKGILLKKELTDITIDADAYTLSTVLSESDTLKLHTGTIETEIILKYNSGTVFRSHTEQVQVEDTLLNREEE